jgi:hypothetical protein
MSAHATTNAVDTPRLEKSQGAKLVNMGGALAVVGLLLCGAAAAVDHERFAFSYLTGFMFVLTLGLGALFFVIVQHLTRAGWSVAARRQMEWLSGILPVLAVLFIPIVVFAHTLYHHWMGEQAAHDEVLLKKAAYLNPTFFYVRAVIYFVIWSGLSYWFRSRSAKQDETGDKQLTLGMQGFSALAVPLFALSLTFAAFDWVMSLDPHWFSTIFGVYIFAGSLVGALSVLALMTVQLQARGFFQRVSTVEHQHDIGKLMFGFTVFWTYIAFSQYFLIWYANIPEETLFYLHRQEGSWMMLTTALPLCHFVVPFFGLLSRTVKRSRVGISIAAVWLLCMHYLDLYWLIMPTLDHHGIHFSWIDLAGLLGPVGVLCGWLAIRASKDNLYPLKDPRLEETYRVDNP